MAKRILLFLQLVIFVALVLFNFLNSFVPEVGFDALWYHLTLPKLWLTNQRWFFPGGLLYYSAMPRLAETLFIPLVQFSGYVGPKLLQFFAGLTVCLAVYHLSRRLFPEKLFCLLAVNLFYATWLASWQSSSAYVDLIRAAFEVWAFVLLLSGRKLWGGVLLGLALSVKWQALTSLVIALFFSPLAVLVALVIFSPWAYLAFRLTGNPLYPLNESFMIKTQLAQVPSDYYQPLIVLKRIITSPIFFTKPIEDFLSPLAGLMVILSLFCLISSRPPVRRLAFIAWGGIISLLLIPPPSSRYFLPHLPFLALTSVYFLSRLRLRFALILVFLFTLSGTIIVAGRALVTWRNLDFLLGKQSINQYLTARAAKLPGTFIDADGFVSRNLPRDGRYLVNNLHNLYYFPFAFDHLSWADPQTRYDYLVTQGISPAFAPGILLNTNSLGIQVFKL